MSLSTAGGVPDRVGRSRLWRFKSTTIITFPTTSVQWALSQTVDSKPDRARPDNNVTANNKLTLSNLLESRYH